MTAPVPAAEQCRRIHYTALTIVDLVGFYELSGYMVDAADDDRDLAYVLERIKDACDHLRIFVEEA